ncbi:MAG: transposase, partial [bacterium]
GRKVSIESLRARSRDGRKEIPLKSYRAFQSQDGMSGRAYRDLIRGISTRDYHEGIDGMLRGYGIKKSSVSRHFIRASEGKLKELMERRIEAIDPVVIFIDGKGFAENLIIAAIGVDSAGIKHVLGIWQGATENAAVCAGLIADLVRRGLDPAKKYLFVMDGAKALVRDRD